MNRNRLLLGAAAGTAAGIALGGTLKWIQHLTGSLVYTLLLNIDFIPYVPATLPEPIEFALHLIVAASIGAGYAALAANRHPWLASAIVTLPALLLFYPLTAISDRTPQPDDLTALAWWSAGHILFAAVLVLFGFALKLHGRR